MANALTDLLDDEDLHESARNFKKSAGQIKKSSKSIVKAAKGNIFEFPVFVANSVPLDYATATVSLLEQVYASYLQMAISINPIIDDKTAREGSQFDHLKSDTSKYLECVDPTDMPYAFDACHSVYTENGIVAEFNLVNIEDATARIINEAMDHEPLSEFDHFFSETYSGDGAGFFEGCTWIQEADDDDEDGNNDRMKQPWNPTYYPDEQMVRRSNEDIGTNAIRSLYHGLDEETKKDLNDDFNIKNASDWQDHFTDSLGIDPEEFAEMLKGKNPATVHNEDLKAFYDARIAQEKLKSMTDENSPAYRQAKADADAAEQRLENMLAERLLTRRQTINAKQDHDIKAQQHEWNVADRNNFVKQLNAQVKKVEAEADIAEKQKKSYDVDYQRQVEKDNADIFNKKASGAKALSDISKNEREDQWAREDRELDRMKKLNDARMKTPQMLDETKIQKLNTMKPLMMSVDLNVVDENGSLSRPVSYVIGVKCHTRLIESNILPEVAAYPLKEMNNKLRKIKWRSGELKFGKDLLWKIGSKKQTAVDSHDKKRKWYRRLYELSHMSGDGLAAASVKNGKSPWANWWQDKLTGGYNKNVGHGLIPNATIVMSKSDVDNIKREKDIDLLSGSKAAKFCKELFLIGLVVIDDDAESVKVLLPDLHEDYDVMSIAAVKKQLAQLDTAGNKTRDIMKLLG